MNKQTKAATDNMKKQMADVTEEFSPEEREAFFNEISEWAYSKYEESILCTEPEMQNYDDEDYPGIL